MTDNRVIPLGPRIREREFQAALDQAAAELGWGPDPWRLRPLRASKGSLRGHRRSSLPHRERETAGNTDSFRPVLRVAR